MNSALPKPASGSDPAEATLRLIATLPAPDGLVDRVQSNLRSAPATARVLPWRRPLWMHSSVVRSAAAAAIVCVVAGGGWRIYTRVETPSSAKVLQMPAPAQPSAPFSTGNAMRVPQSLDRPVLTHPRTASAETDAPAVQPKSAHPGRKKSAGKLAVLPRR